MRIFDKKNGTLRTSKIPLKNLKKFFDMSKSTEIAPILQRNGLKNSYVI
jgi:hypothetical protein